MTKLIYIISNVSDKIERFAGSPYCIYSIFRYLFNNTLFLLMYILALIIVKVFLL